MKRGSVELALNVLFWLCYPYSQLLKICTQDPMDYMLCMPLKFVFTQFFSRHDDDKINDILHKLYDLLVCLANGRSVKWKRYLHKHKQYHWIISDNQI